MSSSESFKVLNELADVLSAEHAYSCIFCGVKKDRIFHTNSPLIKRIRKEKGFVCANCAWNVEEIMATNHKIIENNTGVEE